MFLIYDGKLFLNTSLASCILILWKLFQFPVVREALRKVIIIKCILNLSSSLLSNKTIHSYSVFLAHPEDEDVIDISTFLHWRAILSNFHDIRSLPRGVF